MNTKFSNFNTFYYSKKYNPLMWFGYDFSSITPCGHVQQR